MEDSGWVILPEDEEAWRIRVTRPPAAGHDDYFADDPVYVKLSNFTDTGVWLCEDDWSEFDDRDESMSHVIAVAPLEEWQNHMYEWHLEKYKNDGTGAWEVIESGP